MLRFFVSITGLLFPFTTFSQLPVACGGGTAPAIICEQACIACNFDGYFGSTQGYPSGPAVDFCGTVENAQWIGFIAGKAEAVFTVYPSDCSDGNGVQIALYEDCTQAPLACNKGEENGGKIPVSIKVPLTPGRTYFLLIDGYAGDQCDFTVDVTPKEAVYEPPLGVVQDIQGPTQGCPGATFTYAVPPVFGASAYIWDGPPGTLVDSLPVPAVIPGGNTVKVTLGSQSGPLCVQAANACEQNPPCSGTLYINILDDSHRPLLVADTLQHLNCSGSPAKLLVEINPPADYTLQWTADSLGHIATGGSSAQARVDKAGHYTLRATNNITGCASELAIQVGEPDTPRMVDLALRHITCYGKKDGGVQIGAVTGGKAPYLYALDEAPFMVSPEFRHLPPGAHHLVIEGADGCSYDTTFMLHEPDDLVLDLDPDTTIHLGQEIALWRDGALSDPGRRQQLAVTAPLSADMLCDTCMYRPLASFRYEITVSDSNGCTASDRRTITVDKNRQVYFPNAFAPDAGDDNAVFRIYCGDDVARVRTFRLYNRWGKMLVEENDRAPNDPALRWDGRVDGEKVPPAVFVYFADIEFADGARVQYRGDVALVR